VERLLSSPNYGERWASHWLDGVRYVEEVGYYNFSDLGWRYRDWVIEAINDDMPYNQFIIHQIAGDLLPDPDGGKTYANGIIATGFLCMGNYDDQESDKDQLYSEVVDDQIDVITRQFLGLTVSCARCHDHKFDPIPTSDYYAMAGIFMSTRVLETKSRIGAKRLSVSIHSEEDIKKRTSIENQTKELSEKIKNLPDKDSDEAKQNSQQLQKIKSLPLPKTGMAMAAQEGAYSNSQLKQIGDMPIYIRGDYNTKGPLAPRAVLQVIAGKHSQPISERTKQSGRLELAHWIADPENPLTSRVMVNRIWQNHFGSGIVKTPSNFGSLGERPTHPKLLDWLAFKFTKSAWSVKAMHREIVLSSTYRQQSESTDSILNDPENKLFARYGRRRLEAEQLHDSILFVSGMLKSNAKKGSGSRAIYTHTGHLKPWRFGQIFDSPPTGTMISKREQSVSAPQSLFLLNDSLVTEAAQHIASKFKKSLSPLPEQISEIYLSLYGRKPTRTEMEIALNYLKTAKKPWTFYQVLLCSNEFLHIE
jgi:hypothetical protein